MKSILKLYITLFEITLFEFLLLSKFGEIIISIKLGDNIPLKIH